MARTRRESTEEYQNLVEQTSRMNDPANYYKAMEPIWAERDARRESLLEAEGREDRDTIIAGERERAKLGLIRDIMARSQDPAQVAQIFKGPLAQMGINANELDAVEFATGKGGGGGARGALGTGGAGGLDAPKFKEFGDMYMQMMDRGMSDQDARAAIGSLYEEHRNMLGGAPAPAPGGGPKPLRTDETGAYEEDIVVESEVAGPIKRTGSRTNWKGETTTYDMGAQAGYRRFSNRGVVGDPTGRTFQAGEMKAGSVRDAIGTPAVRPPQRGTSAAARTRAVASQDRGLYPKSGKRMVKGATNRSLLIGPEDPTAIVTRRRSTTTGSTRSDNRRRIFQ